MTAALYARISSLKDDRGVSIERQVDECLRLAQSLGFTISKQHIYIDSGKPSKHLQRPAVQALIKEIKAGNISDLFIWKLERLTRSVKDTEDLKELIRKHHVTVHAVSGIFDVSTPEGELLTGMEAQLAQYWRQKTSKAIKDYYATLRRDNIYLGRRPPFGLMVHGNGKQRKLAPHPDTFPVVLAFLEMYADEKAFAHARGASFLVARGLSWRDFHGNERKPLPIDLQRVIKLLHLYTPFLSPSLARRVQRVRDKRKNHKENSNVRRYDSLLRRVIECADCGSKLWMHRSDQWTYSYRHPFNNCPYAGKTVSHRAPDAAVTKRLEQELLSLSPESLAQIRDVLLTPPADPFTSQRLERLRLQAQLDKLVDEWLEVGLTPEQFRTKRDKLQSRLDAVPEPPPPAARQDPQEVYALIELLLSDPKSLLGESVEASQRFVAAVFGKITFDFKTRETKSWFVWEIPTVS